jgi:adenosylmethionine-8-amino-7-oxononanoate aminotransferase
MDNDDTEDRSSVPTNHSRLAGRVPAGLEQPVILAKNGMRHIRRLPNGKQEELLSVGLACSESFSGPRLAKILQPGFDYERQVMQDLLAGSYAAPLSLHTSAGISEAFGDFVEALEPHLPWKNANERDWCVSLQMEGASALWAAIDMVLQEAMLTTGNPNRKLIAVGSVSYHGPPSTSAGSDCPMWAKTFQVKYPVPMPGQDAKETESLITKFQEFLDVYGDDIGVLLIEPQWGSSQAAFPWPKDLLKQYVELARARGIRIVADEIMCGMGRHGHGSMFVSKDWDLDPDAVTFGKSVGGGVYPLAGAILKTGRDLLCHNGRTVMQSHTYSGSSVRALMTATEVLRELPHWFSSVQEKGEEMEKIFEDIGRLSDGMLLTHGQGLLWGCVVSSQGPLADASVRKQAIQILRKHCDAVGVLPYFVPVGGFMITPVFDIEVETLHEMGEKLVQVMERTMEEMRWAAKVKEAALVEDPATLERI